MNVEGRNDYYEKKFLLSFQCILGVSCFRLCFVAKKIIHDPIPILIPQKASETNAEDNTEKNTVTKSADYPEYEDANTLVDSTDLIFSGTVKDISYEKLDVRTEKGESFETDGEELSYTIFEISVDQVYKGSIDGDTIRIKRLGGKTDDTEYVSSDAIEISIGNKYLFLAETYEDSYPSLVNMTQSVYNMGDAQGKGTVSYRKNPNQDITLSDIMKFIDK